MPCTNFRSSLALALLLALTVLGASLPSTARADDADGWHWIVAPYVWLPSLSGDASLPERDPSLSVSAGDILDDLEFGFLMRFDGSSDRWRFLSDSIYLGLGKRSKRDVADLDFDTVMIELAGAFRPNEHWDVIFGGRYWNADFKIDFDDDLIADVDADDSWVDPFVGFRATAPLGESWDFQVRGDIGGFGVGSDFTWNAEMLFGWSPNERFTLVFGYRHLDLDTDWDAAGEKFDLNIALSGPELGFAFRF